MGSQSAAGTALKVYPDSLLTSQQAYDERNPHYHMYYAFEETEAQKNEVFE